MKIQQFALDIGHNLTARPGCHGGDDDALRLPLAASTRDEDVSVIIHSFTDNLLAGIVTGDAKEDARVK